MTNQKTEDSRQRTEILLQLCRVLEIPYRAAEHDVLSSVMHLVTDSRAIQRGDTFVAYPGEKSDGRNFIAQAIERGANAVIWDSHQFTWNDAWQIPNLAVTDLRHQAGWLADAVYGNPSEKMWVVGITGTNGKTSTSHWIAGAMNNAGKKCALIGTLGNGFPSEDITNDLAGVVCQPSQMASSSIRGQKTGAMNNPGQGTGSTDLSPQSSVLCLQPTLNTTPDAIRLHGLLADYLALGAQNVAMEVSSHALAQGRVNGVRFNVALLTNLSRDHLDYHGDMQSYAASKRKLFEWKQLKYAVLNLDDAFGVELAESLQEAEVEVIGYGMSNAALQLAERLGLRMVYGNLVQMTGQGLQLEVHSSWGAAQIDSELVGRFNAANLLGVLAVLLVSEISLSDAVLSLSKAQPVAGRMQRVSSGQQPTVIVDFAHSPDALEKVLLALREVRATAGSKLICVFGCGGDRDRGKRAMMGKVVEEFSDWCVVTSDNPRSEDPQQIIAEIVAGMRSDNHEIIVERAAAIQHAISRAQKTDTVLIAGKGHEDYQEICGVKYPFNDVLVAKQALEVSHAEVLA